MTPRDCIAGLTDGHSLRRVGLSRLLQVTTLMMVLLALPMGSGPAHAAPTAAPPAAHVYLMRGLLNIFSLGMDEIASKLRQQGIEATVHNHLAWALVADEAAAEYKAGRIKTIVLVGHSSGATVLPDMVARLDQRGAPVKLAIGLDSVFRTSLSGRVGRYINFYVANGAGTAVQPTSQLRGKLENVDVEKMGVGHLTIDKNQAMQQKIISAIDAAVFSRPTGAPGTRNRPADANTTSSVPDTARASATARN